MVSTSLRKGGSEILLVFDEEIDISTLKVNLESGIEIQSTELDLQHRSLRLRLAEPLEGEDKLELAGVKDRAQQANQIETLSLRIEPPFWPTSRGGLAFVFQTANAPNLVWDSELGAETAVQLSSRGLARLDSRYSLLPGGGSFAARLMPFRIP